MLLRKFAIAVRQRQLGASGAICIRRVAAGLRRDRGATHRERAVGHHPARHCRERKERFSQFRIDRGVLRVTGLLSGAGLLSRGFGTAVMCLGDVATGPFDCGLSRLLVAFCGHRHVAATQQASARQPHRNTDGQKQSDHFKGNQKTHWQRESNAQQCFCREM